MIDHHVTPEQAEEVFARGQPKGAVYSHIVLPTAATDDAIPPMHQTYAGRTVMNEVEKQR